jgi:hypothetical protein
VLRTPSRIRIRLSRCAGRKPKHEPTVTGSESRCFAIRHGSAWMRADFHLHIKADKEFTYAGSDPVSAMQSRSGLWSYVLLDLK